KNRIRINSITTQRMDDLSQWYGTLNEQAKNQMRPDDMATGPTGAGYVFTLKGVHFHHGEDVNMQYAQYVVETLLKNLKQWTVTQQDSKTPIPVRQLGITHPTIVGSNIMR